VSSGLNRPGSRRGWASTARSAGDRAPRCPPGELGLVDVEIATLDWADRLNNRRLHTELADIPPVEREARHYRRITDPTTLEAREPSLH